MTDFDYECLQRKKLAGQAKYRKCGSKSKKCTLPSDKLTQKQWKERCGPVMSFNFNKPMTWDNFKALPGVIQAEYITNLQKNYGATAADLGDMFGVRALTVRRYVDSNCLNISFPRGHAMSAARRSVWNEFLGANIVDDSKNMSENYSEEATIKDLLSDTDKPEVLNDPVNTELEAVQGELKSMHMKKFCLQFSGTIDIDAISNSLRLILGNQASGELEIICNLS